MERNWAGNVDLAGEVRRPGTLAELQELVAASPRIRAVGTRHSFSPLAQAAEGGVLVSLERLAEPATIDADGLVRVVGPVPYAALVDVVAAAGRALPNLGSLPHISVIGAVSTGTHGSGDARRTLSAAVTAIDLVGADGSLRTVARGDAEFPGSVVALGLLGIVTAVTIETVPAARMRQDVYPALAWDDLVAGYADVTAAGESVSVFLESWAAGLGRVFVKRHAGEPAEALRGARRATEPVPIIAGSSMAALTVQGVDDDWHRVLPHFRSDAAPSNAGDELQSEYFVAREHAPAALRALRGLAPAVDPLLLVTELRTVAADDLWLSGASGRDTTAIHFTWRFDPAGVAAVLPGIEEALRPFDPRPHWGKLFSPGLRPSHPRLPDFRDLVGAHDPAGVFGTAFTAHLLDR